MSIRYYLLHPSGRYFLRLKVRRFLKGIVCLFRGHDIEPLVDANGREKVQVVRMRSAVRYVASTKKATGYRYRCHRCFKFVPKTKK